MRSHASRSIRKCTKHLGISYACSYVFLSPRGHECANCELANVLVYIDKLKLIEWQWNAFNICLCKTILRLLCVDISHAHIYVVQHTLRLCLGATALAEFIALGFPPTSCMVVYAITDVQTLVGLGIFKNVLHVDVMGRIFCVCSVLVVRCFEYISWRNFWVDAYGNMRWENVGTFIAWQLYVCGEHTYRIKCILYDNICIYGLCWRPYGLKRDIFCHYNMCVYSCRCRTVSYSCAYPFA